jgi:6-phosphogluconolactonase
MSRAHPHLTVVADADALAQLAAEHVMAQVIAHGNDASDRLAICLAGGSTPVRLYELMTSEPYRHAMPWRRIHWFWGDERLVPHDDACSNFAAARRLLDHVPVPPGNIHAIPTSSANVDEAARRYETELRSFYGADQLDPRRPLFDVVLLGVGSDGHTASLFPGHAELEERRRWVVGVGQPGLEPFVPRVTLTFPALASTREMLFLVSGHGKREIMTRVLSKADLPATRAYAEGDLVWLVDREAAPEQRDVA